MRSKPKTTTAIVRTTPPATPTPPAAPAAAATTPDPLRQVVNWIIAGHTEPDIVEAIAANWPSQKSRPLIVKAVAEIAKAGSPDTQALRGFAIEGTREIYRKALEVGDHQTALRALKQLVELSR